MMMMSLLHQQARRILASSSQSFLLCRSYSTLRGPIKTNLEKWLKQGNLVEPSYVRGLIKDLRDTHCYPQALEALEWMCEQRVFHTFPEDYAARLHLVETVLGLDEAEKFFKSIPENMKDYSVYDILLRSYTKSEKTLDKVESTFEKMRDLGFLLKTSPYNSMISLYGQLKKQDMVEKLQRELKENKESKTWVDEKQRKPEKLWNVAMEKPYDKASRLEMDIEMYGNVPGYKREVYRLWNMYKKGKYQSDYGYRSMISSLLKLDDVQGAEKIYGEWEPYKQELDMRIPELLITRFRKEGNESKAKEVVKSIRKKRIMKRLRMIMNHLRMIGPTLMCFGVLATIFISLHYISMFMLFLDENSPVLFSLFFWWCVIYHPVFFFFCH